MNAHLSQQKNEKVAFTIKHSDAPEKYKCSKVLNEAVENFDFAKLFPSSKVVYRVTYLSSRDNKTWPTHLSSIELDKIALVIAKVIPVLQNTAIYSKLREFNVIKTDQPASSQN